MILGCVIGQVLASSQHREKFANTFFKLNQNPQSKALALFKKEVLGDGNEEPGLISRQMLISHNCGN